ncbi:hypothetical protein CMZ84_10105 [Lysobacteraceae bacterium NML93-0399]|nr:hypothetical protein CMZ84_10105 [Xanthomonadaceae bacterium NML93-0399]
MGCVPRRPRSAGNRRGFMRRIASGERTFWFLLGPSKRNSHATAGESLALCLGSDFCACAQQQEAKSKSNPELPRASRAAYFCLVKSKQNRFRRTRADAMKPHRSPALLA